MAWGASWNRADGGSGLGRRRRRRLVVWGGRRPAGNQGADLAEKKRARMPSSAKGRSSLKESVVEQVQKACGMSLPQPALSSHPPV